MSKEIIELVQNCNLVRFGSEDNGHDCWGNREWSEYKYVLIDGKEERIWDNWYVVHDGKNVKEVLSSYLYESRIKDEERKLAQEKHFNETGFRTPAEYSAYLKGKTENNNNK